MPNQAIIVGEHPFDVDPEIAALKLRWCLEEGVRSFVDLARTQDGKPSYIGILFKLTGELEIPFRYANVPTFTGTRLTRESVTCIAGILSSFAQLGGLVYVHGTSEASISPEIVVTKLS